MVGKREAKREDLKARLIQAATNRIVRDGVGNLRARDIAQDAECALGGLYTVFQDLDDLVIHVNSTTLRMLEESLALSEAREMLPVDQLRSLAQGYLKFATSHRNLWKSLFDHTFVDGRQAPQWHLDEHLSLMSVIAEPLARLQSHLSPQDRAIRARTLFGAVHGVVSVSLEARFVGLPAERLAREVDEFVLTIAAGMSKNNAD